MKKLLVLFSAIFLFSSFTSEDLNKSHSTASLISSTAIGEFIIANREKLATIKIKEIEKIAGRKLTFKEKIAFKIYQYKIKKELNDKKEEKKPSKGQTAFILGLIGIGSLLIPYASLAAIPLAILAIVIGSKARKENPNDGKAQTGIILGIVTLGLIALAIILIIAIIEFGGWWV